MVTSSLFYLSVPRPVLRAVALLSLVIASIVTLAACGEGKVEPEAGPADTNGMTESGEIDETAYMVDVAHYDSLPANDRPLTGGKSSARELVEAAVTAFEKKDTATLRDLIVTRPEFMEILYPEYGMHFPAARDMREETKEFLWENQILGTAESMTKGIALLEGKRYRVVGIAATDTLSFTSYSISEGTAATLAGNDGTMEFKGLGAILEKNGRFKLLSYRDPD